MMRTQCIIAYACIMYIAQSYDYAIYLLMLWKCIAIYEKMATMMPTLSGLQIRILSY